jgi:hypothetical protein
MKKLYFFLLVILASLAFSFDFEPYAGWNVTIDSSNTSSFYSVFLDFPLTVNNDTEFGISLGYIGTNNFVLQSFGKYNIKTSFGIFTTYGKGGAVFSSDFKLNSIGYSVLAGVRYYFKNFFVGFSYAVYYIEDEKIGTIPLEVGYKIEF